MAHSRRRRYNPDSNFDEGDCDDDRLIFADPGGRSALRAAGPGNPRNRSCPNCKRRNVLTPADVARGYQCDSCADRAEGNFGGSFSVGEY